MGLLKPIEIENKPFKPFSADAVYQMDLRKDRFIHFTTQTRALEIISGGKLLMKPPYAKFGPDKIYAVSLVWGRWVPRTQTTHIKDGSALVGIIFRTPTKPYAGWPEEVIWDRDVVLRGVSLVPAKKGAALIKRTPEAPPEDDFYVVYQ